MGIKSFVAAVNKMDLVDYNEETFQNISDDFKNLANELNVSDVV